MDAFVGLVNEHNQRTDLLPATPVDDILFDDLSRVELAAFLSDRLGKRVKETDLVAGGSSTLADLFGEMQRKGLVEAAVAPAVKKRENLYFKRLLQGVDVSVGGAKDPITQMRFQIGEKGSCAG